MTEDGDHDKYETLNVALQGERDNLGMALEEKNWSLVENTVDRLQELKEKVRAGRIDLPEYGSGGESSTSADTGLGETVKGGGEPPKPSKDTEEMLTAAYEVWCRENGEEKMALMRNLPEKATVNNELVRRSDAEHRIAKERSRKFDEGFFEGRKEERQRITELIKEQMTAWRKRKARLQDEKDYNGDKELEIAKAKAVFDELSELLDEVQPE